MNNGFHKKELFIYPSSERNKFIHSVLNSGIKKKFIFLFFLFSQIISAAQSDTESEEIESQKVWAFRTTQQLSDTAWWALQQKTTSQFMSLIPTYDILKATFDSLEIKKDPQIIRIKYNLIYYKVSKQLKALNAKAAINKLKLKSCEKDTVKIKEGQDEKGNAFAYITIECHKTKRQFTIKFVALQLNKNWYIVDELKMEFPEDDPYYKPPVKVKQKKKQN